MTPERIWSDAKADIAVLKLDRDDLPAARLGNSDTAVVGSWVLALGSPFGLMHSVSQGIISARGRHMDELQDVENQDFLQTDAAINPGNSGGPLVNMKGEVIGINNSIASNGGGNEGVGFSIPINLARWIMNELIVQRPRDPRGPGRRSADRVPPGRRDDAGAGPAPGRWIDKVHPESPAAQGGLHDGDVILRFGGVEIHDLNHLINTVSMTPVGQSGRRGRSGATGRKPTIRITVGETATGRWRNPGAAAHRGRRGPADLIRRPNRPDATSSFAHGAGAGDPQSPARLAVSAARPRCAGR